MTFESSLSPDVLDLVEMNPVEDLLIELFKTKLPGVFVQTLIKEEQFFPLVLFRNAGAWGEWNGDPRFIDAGQLDVHAFCEGINGDQDAALLSEAVRVVLRDSRNVVVPGRGHITKVQMMTRPRRVTDWATATGPVQYADLPTGVWRYQTTYQVEIRKPRSRPYPTP